MLLEGVYASTPLDQESLSQGALNISRRTRTNPLPWSGQFSPQLVETLLSAACLPPGALVLDPFLGSGTTLVEAARLGLSSRGSEVNPAAVVLSRIYELCNLDSASRRKALGEIRTQLNARLGAPHGPLFNGALLPSQDRAGLEAQLVDLWRGSASDPEEILSAALVVLCDFHQKKLDVEKVHRTWSKLERMVRELPSTRHPIAVHHTDARTLPLETNCVDLVLTSPPYINVFNYHQKFRRSVEALEWDVLKVARSEIGSNRQNRGNRFLTVVQYSLDMAQVLCEAARVAKIGSSLIFVLGRESNVRGTSFFNGELVAELGVCAVGLYLEKRQERVFRNRYGADIYEDILHFQLPTKVRHEEQALVAARDVAGDILTSARSCAPEKERVGLEEALERLAYVDPSPVLAPPPLTCVI